MNYLDLWGLSASDKGFFGKVGDFFSNIGNTIAGLTSWALGTGTITNNSDRSVVVILEKPDKKTGQKTKVLEPGGKPHTGRHDGVIDQDGNAYKGNSGGKVTVTNNGFTITGATKAADDFANGVKDVFKPDDEKYGTYPKGTAPPGVNAWGEKANDEHPGWKTSP
ncbi:hypothetical protein FACS189491_06830 [Spirochaetia bacterium]|nr:hypothetical protein FACS189491_06830 [Spirochaetia bacterium]